MEKQIEFNPACIRWAKAVSEQAARLKELVTFLESPPTIDYSPRSCLKHTKQTKNTQHIFCEAVTPFRQRLPDNSAQSTRVSLSTQTRQPRICCVQFSWHDIKKKWINAKQLDFT
jgi:hypothetical protein